MEMKNSDPHFARCKLPVVRPRVGIPRHFVSLCRKYFGFDTHYGSAGTFYCPNDDSCVACRSGAQQRWNGYLIGKSQINEDRAIICLTAAAACDLLTSVDGPRGLWGARITLVRDGAMENSPVAAKVTGWEEECPLVTSDKLVEIIQTLYRKKLKGGNSDNGK